MQIFSHYFQCYNSVLAAIILLSGLYDTKPPISKAKMAAITKAAMRAIKFYKHVVQSVEKFILKCKPEYKVPGLYVIDSIVRQSRHQFGPEKDVFAPRFARNIKETFANLFRCVAEDKSRIIRVLNLWQKNNVFAPEVIQPIFDLADPNHPIYSMPPQQQPCGLNSGGGGGGTSNSISGSVISVGGGCNLTGSVGGSGGIGGIVGNVSGSGSGAPSSIVSSTLGNATLNDVLAANNSANGLNNNTNILSGNSTIGHNITNIDMLATGGGSGNIATGSGGGTSQMSSHHNDDKLQNANLSDLSQSSIVMHGDNNHKSSSRNNLNMNLRTLDISNNLKYATKQRCSSTNNSNNNNNNINNNNNHTNNNNNNNSCGNMNMSINAPPPPPPPPLPSQSSQSIQSTQSLSTIKMREHNKYGIEMTTSGSGSGSGGGNSSGSGIFRNDINLTGKIYHSENYNKYHRNAGSGSGGGGGSGSGSGISHQLHHAYEYEENTNLAAAIHHHSHDNDDHNNDDNIHHHDNNNDVDDYGDSSIECQSPKNTSSSNTTTNNLLDNNNLKQLLNDPNVLRQLQTLQNFQKFKQDDKQHNNNLRLQEEAFEKHLQNVLKANVAHSINPDPNEYSKEVEFVSEEQKIEVITLDGNDSGSPTPERDRYKRRRSRSRSRSRERDRDRDRERERDRISNRRSRRSRTRSRSRSRSRSPPPLPMSSSSRGSRRGRNSRERERERDRERERERSNRDKERDREHERERRKRGLPDIRKENLSVCSTTLWVGHLSKLVYQEELSDTFGEFGDIVSIDQIVPRGCAFIVMNRRQDAYRAMQTLRNHKLQGRAITISWAAGKGVKSKEWKDFWDLELGVTYIPWHKLDESTDFDSLEEGGMFDEDSMPLWMKELVNKKKSVKEKVIEAEKVTAVTVPVIVPPGPPPNTNQPIIFGIDTSQPPPEPPGPAGHPPPPLIPMVPGQFPMAAPPIGGPPNRILGPPIGMPIGGIHMPPNIVQPHPAMIMMPGFGCVSGQMGGPNAVPPHIGPGPTRMPTVGAAPPNPSHGHPAHFAGPPPPVTSIATNLINSNINVGPSAEVITTTTAPALNTADDQMDIEMDDDESSVSHISAHHQTSNSNNSGENSVNFNQPPPVFNTSNIPPSVMAIDNNTSNIVIGETDGISGNDVNDIFIRDRRSQSSRWSGRGASSTNLDEARWHEENTSTGGPPPYHGGGRALLPDFIDNRGRMSGQNFNGGGNDFHSNLTNRFQSPTNLMQMRIPPPNAFNTRGPGGLPPMFMRGQGGPGGRPQGSGFYNRNNPFDRDNHPFSLSRGGGNRGGAVRGGGNRGRHNWDDEDKDDTGYKRRIGGAGIMGPNRFRDRGEIANDDRHNHNHRGNGRRGNISGGTLLRERDNRSHTSFINRRNSSENSQKTIPQKTIKANNSTGSDSEDDWDRELEDYDVANKHNSNSKINVKDVTITNIILDDDESENKGDSTSLHCVEGDQNESITESHQSLPNQNDKRNNEMAEEECEINRDNNVQSNGSITMISSLHNSDINENPEMICGETQKPHNELSLPAVKLTDAQTDVETEKNAAAVRLSVVEMKTESSATNSITLHNPDNDLIHQHETTLTNSSTHTNDIDLTNDNETYCV